MNNTGLSDSHTIERIFNIIETRLSSLWQVSDSLDAKGTTILGFGGIIVSIAFSAYPIMKPIRVLFIIGIIFLLCGILLSSISIKSYKYRHDPKPRGLYEGYADKKDNEVLNQLVQNLIDSYENNEKIIEKKARMIDYGSYSIFVGLIFFCI